MLLIAIALQSAAQPPRQRMEDATYAWMACGTRYADRWVDQNETASDLAALATARCTDERRQAREAIEEYARSERAMSAVDRMFDETERSVRQVIAVNVLEARTKDKARPKPVGKR